MIKKLKTFFWFIKKPQYIPQIVQVLKRNSNKDSESSSTESTTWCKKHVVAQKDALNILLGCSDLFELPQLFPVDFKWAKNQEKECPFTMGGEGATSFLYHIVKSKRPNKVLETGVAYGWSSLAILLGLENNENGFLVSNDMPYIKMNNDEYVGCVIPDRLKQRWKLQRAADVNGIPKALEYFDNELDLIHYDSDKSYYGRMWASPILWSSLNAGGLFISDDINDNLGFKHFGESVNRTPIIVEHQGKYVGVLTK